MVAKYQLKGGDLGQSFRENVCALCDHSHQLWNPRDVKLQIEYIQRCFGIKDCRCGPIKKRSVKLHATLDLNRAGGKEEGKGEGERDRRCC